eukprot:CAMPEP_0169223000 /NCGR_PEP_ID=MMETSP1016-20121227/21890_1 /TAXON_ID=342587 /ORGANISM="Karlodinium micrum, Strain CCMP2283" /LENGTH=197 /DNA_ID=CAMNT_0009301329 /DNA_START=460 /DNA_END=1054 /DNA_ORIENTATION=-
MGSKKVTFTKVVVFVMLVLLCIGLALGCTEKTGEEASSPDFSRSALGYRTDQHDFKRPASLVIEGHDGDWAKKYRGAERTQKQALDLLYLCNIIPPEEFLTAKVREDHIDECIWIANAMLKQKTIREWLEGGDYAREFFNSCVTALYEARSDIKDSKGTSHHNVDVNGTHLKAHSQFKIESLWKDLAVAGCLIDVER